MKLVGLICYFPLCRSAMFSQADLHQLFQTLGQLSHGLGSVQLPLGTKLDANILVSFHYLFLPLLPPTGFRNETTSSQIINRELN